MEFFANMLPPLLTGISILMAGILICREHRQTPSEALAESCLWGAGFFVAFSAEIAVLAQA